MANFTPSKYQQAVYDFISNQLGNAVVNAVAGSGKSTTIINALTLVPNGKTSVFLAFNKSIIAELKMKIGNNSSVDVRTINSLGYRSVANAINWRKGLMPMDDYKYANYIKDCVKFGKITPTMPLDGEETNTYIANMIKLVNLYRVNLCNSIADIELIADKYQIAVYDNECEKIGEIVKWGLGNKSTFDFTDQIYMPVALGFRVEQFDFVFVDECQDLSACQRALFLMAMKPNGRFIAVGDPNQAIYGFAGADIDSFNALKSIKNTIELPLSVCYRCGSVIVDRAKKLVPQIEAKENAHMGEIIYDVTLDMIADNDLILSRVNAPLIALCMRFISQNRKAYVKGRDIGANLANMLNNTKCNYVIDAMKKLDNEGAKVLAKIQRKRACSMDEAITDSTYQLFLDKVQAIDILSNGLQYVSEVVNRIYAIFKDDSVGICLSSVHKAKGLEADRVFIICPEKFYNKYAMKIAWMAQQEANLEYVAITRAKKTLAYVADKEMEFYTSR